MRILKLGHGLDVSGPVHNAMVFMAERLTEKSSGQVRIDIYPSQQLGSERECLELPQIGNLAIANFSKRRTGRFRTRIKHNETTVSIP